MHQMELLDDMCHKESHFGPFRESKKPFLTHLFVLLDEEAQVEARFTLFGDSASLDAR